MLDQKEGRVATFNSNGKLVGSFTFGSYGFAGLSMSLAQYGMVYVGGIRRPPRPGSPMIYEFKSNGTLLRRFDPQDPAVSRLHLSPMGWVSVGVNSSGTIFAAQAVSPVVQVYSPDGRLVRSFRVAPSFYRKPFKFPSHLRSPRQLMSLLARWTELLDVWVLPDGGPVLARFWLHSPKSYDLEIYSERGKLLKGGIGTNFVLASVDKSGHLYFYNPKDRDLHILEMQIDHFGAAAHGQ